MDNRGLLGRLQNLHLVRDEQVHHWVASELEDHLIYILEDIIWEDPLLKYCALDAIFSKNVQCNDFSYDGFNREETKKLIEQKSGIRFPCGGDGIKMSRDNSYDDDEDD